MEKIKIKVQYCEFTDVKSLEFEPHLPQHIAFHMQETKSPNVPFNV